MFFWIGKLVSDSSYLTHAKLMHPSAATSSTRSMVNDRKTWTFRSAFYFNVLFEQTLVFHHPSWFSGTPKRLGGLASWSLDALSWLCASLSLESVVGQSLESVSDLVLEWVLKPVFDWSDLESFCFNESVKVAFASLIFWNASPKSALRAGYRSI